MSTRRGRLIGLPLAAGFACLVLLPILVAGGTASSSPPSTSTSTTTTISSASTSTTTQSLLADIGVPLGIPSTPVQNITDCPANPTFTSPLPQGATISVSLGTATDTASATFNGVTQGVAGRCVYTVSLPNSDPVTLVFQGNIYMAEDTVYSGGFDNQYNQLCQFSYEGGNFYVAVASIKNDTGYCNTDHVGPWTNVIVVNTAEASGPGVSTTSFGSWAESSLAGTFFFGVYEVCQENPGGQTNNYYCQYIDAGPLL